MLAHCHASRQCCGAAARLRRDMCMALSPCRPPFRRLPTPPAAGTMLFGESTDEAAAMQLMDACMEAGVNFFDSAEMYPVPQRAETAGRSEEVLGHWMKHQPRWVFERQDGWQEALRGWGGGGALAAGAADMLPGASAGRVSRVGAGWGTAPGCGGWEAGRGVGARMDMGSTG